MDRKSKKEIEKRNTLIASIIAGTCGVICFFVLMHFSGMNIGSTFKTLLQLVGVALVIVLIYIIPSIYFDNKYKIVNKITKVKIYNQKNEDENIKITKDNLIFKYSPTVRYKYILPRAFMRLTGTASKSAKEIGKDNPGYKIRGKKQLSKTEIKEIMNKIDNLQEDKDSNIVVKTKEYEKHVNVDEVNKILKSCSSVRIFDYEKDKDEEDE